MTVHRKDIGTRASIVEKQLAQSRPGDTNNVSLYSPSTAVLLTEITSIWICNTTANTPRFRIFLDDNGTTYDQTTALWYDTLMTPNGVFIRDVEIYMNNSDGNLAVRTDTASEITFTVFGLEITKA